MYTHIYHIYIYIYIYACVNLYYVVVFTGKHVQERADVGRAARRDRVLRGPVLL